MRLKHKWVVAGALCVLSIAGFFFVLSVGNRASLGGSKGLGEMLHVPKPEELGAVVPPGTTVSHVEAKGPADSPSLRKAAPTTQEVKRMEQEGAIAY